MSLETKLGNEISVDPLGRGYSGMTDQEVLDDLGTEYIEEDVDTVEGQEIFEATILSELNVLSSKQLQIYMGIIGNLVL